MPEVTVLKPDVEFIRNVKKSGGDTLKQCYQCATCSVVCKLAPRGHPFPRKQMILAQWGLKDNLLGDPAVWMCHQCNDCTEKCPREARPGDVFAAIRAFAFQHFAFPSFMGNALANPGALPVLFLVPVILLLVLMIVSNPGGLNYAFQFSGEVDYARFLPHGYLEMLFIGGNILIFAFAALGLLRFWKGLKRRSQGKDGPSFISALISTGLEIATHRKFSDCSGTRARYLGHMLLFYGTAGAAATAGLALLFTVFLHIFESPINLPNPIKILGVASGIAMFSGGWILMRRRLKDLDAVGNSGYNDWLFIWIIFLVGLTGMLTWLLRLVGIPLIAYIDYFIHLVLVFFLLWYAPYSKFGHMFYRTMGLIYAKSAGLDKPR